jgi:hypothetical protein
MNSDGTGRALTEDQKRILDLVFGRTVHDERGLPHKIYLVEGSPEALEARRALARELRTSLPLDLGLRSAIADMIDPDCDAAERQIQFEHRREGRPSNDVLAEMQIAEFIWSRVQGGDKTESAIQSAMEKFKLVRSRIFEIWRHWKPILKRRKPNRTKPLKRSDW